ncbi:MAG: holo-ACP synthase [Bacteroidetes bacterium]|nr:holo-ACP synthase [Bacteroidota bacterium]MCL5739018.1 holo-ACP synthase [Bacteroidota bacterium]
MVEGVGVDIIEVSRIQKSIEDYGALFMDKIFTSEEKAYCSAKPNPFQHYAARFAAKEAFSKATGTGWNSDFSWQEVEVINEKSGKPFFRLGGLALKSFGNKRIFLSLSHSGDYVVAVVVIEI